MNLPQPKEGLSQQMTTDTPDKDNPNIKLAQPFSRWTHDDMTEAVDHFLEISGLQDYEKYIRRGAFLAQSRHAFRRERQDGLTVTENERKYLDLENSKSLLEKFNQPWKLYAVIAICSLGAAVQGW
jgi:hypothetical protein